MNPTPVKVWGWEKGKDKTKKTSKAYNVSVAVTIPEKL